MPIDDEDLEQPLDDAITDSFDEDWTASVGVRAIMRELKLRNLIVVEEAD